MPNESTRTVVVALAAGFGVALAKAVAAAVTGSAALRAPGWMRQPPGPMRVVATSIRSGGHGRSAGWRLAGRVQARHQLGQVVRLDEGRRRRRAPGRVGGPALPYLRLPQLVLEDHVEVAVVLGEVACRVAQVPEVVGADQVPA